MIWLITIYVDPTKVDLLTSRSVRKLLRAPFSVNRQQDAAEFLEALAIFCTPLKTAYSIPLQHTYDVPTAHTQAVDMKLTLSCH